MKLTESMLRKIIREEIDDTLDYIPPTGQTKGKDYDSADSYSTKKSRPTFRETLQLRAQNGKPIMLNVDLKTFQRIASSNYPTEYTLDGEKRTSYGTSNILPTTGELFKVLKFVGGYSYSSHTDAEVVGSPSRRITQSGELSVVTIQNDKFGKFTVALMPNEVKFGR